jgi:hypothetical protein
VAKTWRWPFIASVLAMCSLSERISDASFKSFNSLSGLYSDAQSMNHMCTDMHRDVLEEVSVRVRHLGSATCKAACRLSG